MNLDQIGPGRDQIEVRSNTWLKAIMESDLPPPARLVALVLNHRRSVSRRCLSIGRIASESGLSRRTVTRHLALLESEGFLSVDRSTGTQNQYTISFPRLLTCPKRAASRFQGL